MFPLIFVCAVSPKGLPDFKYIFISAFLSILFYWFFDKKKLLIMLCFSTHVLKKLRLDFKVFCQLLLLTL